MARDVVSTLAAGMLLPGHGRGLTHVLEQVPVVLQEGAVVAAARDGLRAAQVDVHGVAVGLREQRRLQQLGGVVGAELKPTRGDEHGGGTHEAPPNLLARAVPAR